MSHHPRHAAELQSPGMKAGTSRGPSVAPARRPRGPHRAGLITMIAVAATAVAGCGPSPSQPVDPHDLRRADRIDVSVVGVHDGDTLTGLTAQKRQIKVRLDGIDAPELGQAFGKAAKRALSEKAFGRRAKITVRNHDLYGRIVAQVTVDGHDVGTDLVRAGFAWVDPRFNHDTSLAALEQAARRSKAGLWADKAPVAPWDYRKHRERKAEPPAGTAPAPGWSWFRWWRGAGE